MFPYRVQIDKTSMFFYKARFLEQSVCASSNYIALLHNWDSKTTELTHMENGMTALFMVSIIN